MWLFTQHGFFSVVQHREDPDRFLVRARERQDLTNLLAVGDVPGKILETPAADYGFRVVFTRPQWQQVAAALADTVDYPNFKSRVHERKDQAGKGAVYMRIWWALKDTFTDWRAQQGEVERAWRESWRRAPEEELSEDEPALPFGEVYSPADWWAPGGRAPILPSHGVQHLDVEGDPDSDLLLYEDAPETAAMALDALPRTSKRLLRRRGWAVCAVNTLDGLSYEVTDGAGGLVAWGDTAAKAVSAAITRTRAPQGAAKGGK